MMARLVLRTAVAVVSLYAVSSEAAIPLEEPFPGCRSPLGVSNGSIPGLQITSSSNSNRKLHGSQLATEGWCLAKQKLAYVEVDLGRDMRISALGTTGVLVKNETSGSFTYMYVSQYFLVYKREGSNSWRHYMQDEMTITLFKTNNSNPRVPQKHYLLSPRVARYVRLVAKEGVGKMWCLKVEIYGCPWKNQDGLVSYEISQGNYRDDGRHPLRFSSSLRDISYDGHRLAYGTKVGVLTNGLGQLVDGVLGVPADWNDTHDTNWIEWIGWRDTVTQRPSVTFQFSSLRRFTALRFHVLNYPGIEEKMLFSKVVISFSKDGEYYAWKVIYGPGITKRRQMKDKAFWVHVDLTNNVGQYVTCEFYYQGWWALISEVQFESSVVQGISSNKAGSGSTTPSMRSPTSVNPSPEPDSELNVSANESPKDGKSRRWSPILIAVIIVGGLVAVSIMLLAVWLSKRKTRGTRARDGDARISLRIINTGKKNSLNRRNDPIAHSKMSKKLEELEDEEKVFYKLNNVRRTSLQDELPKESDLDASNNVRPESRELSLEEEKAEVLAEMRNAYPDLT